jgi:TonB-dependent starch-binding outer membrane protein SusC
MEFIYQNSMKKLLITTMMIFSFSVIFAQKKITGKVTDSGNGSTLPGASVVLKGTATGVSTDVNGDYSISVPSNGGTLVYSFVGYTIKEVAIGNQSTINVSMSSDEAMLQEVVVTGYQSLRKRDITGAVTVVEAEGLKSIKGSSFTQNLAGRAAGVTVSSSGSPGDATNVRVRGISSFTSNDPLYIIDGVPVQDQYNNTINPDDIESIQVLKDASSSSIYGSRASNGVIVITTKKGKAGKTKLTYNGSFGLVNSVKGYDDILNTSSTDYAKAMQLKFASDPANTPLFAQNPTSLPKYIQPMGNTVDESTYDILNNQISLTNQEGTNWWKEMTRTAKMNDHNLNISGGNDAATFSISGGYLRQEGVSWNNSCKFKL